MQTKKELMEQRKNLDIEIIEAIDEVERIENELSSIAEETERIKNSGSCLTGKKIKELEPRKNDLLIKQEEINRVVIELDEKNTKLLNCEMDMQFVEEFAKISVQSIYIIQKVIDRVCPELSVKMNTNCQERLDNLIKMRQKESGNKRMWGDTSIAMQVAELRGDEVVTMYDKNNYRSATHSAIKNYGINSSYTPYFAKILGVDEEYLKYGLISTDDSTQEFENPLSGAEYFRKLVKLKNYNYRFSNLLLDDKMLILDIIEKLN